MNEIVNGALTCCINKLHLEKSCTDIKHSALRIELFDSHANSINQMRFSASRRPINEHRVKLGAVGVLCDRKAYGTRQFVAVTFDEIIESLMRIELRVEFLRCCGIKRRRHLIGTCLCLSGQIVVSRLGLNYSCEFVLFIGNDAISQFYVFAEGTLQYLAEQVDIVLLKVLIDEWTRHLENQCLLLFFKRIEDYRLKPCVELLQ